MSEVHQGPGLLQVDQEEKCPKAWLHWEVRGESPRRQWSLEMEGARHSMKGTSLTHEQTDVLRGHLFNKQVKR